MNDRFARELPLGPSLTAIGQTRFRFWAPAQETVSVALEGGPMVPMARSPDGWFEATAHAAAGTRYRYRSGGWHAGAGSGFARAGGRCA